MNKKDCLNLIIKALRDHDQRRSSLDPQTAYQDGVATCTACERMCKDAGYERPVFLQLWSRACDQIARETHVRPSEVRA